MAQLKIATKIKKDRNLNSLCSQSSLTDLIKESLNEHNYQTAAIQKFPVTSPSTLFGFIRSPIVKGVKVMARLSNPSINNENRRNLYQSPAYQPERVVTDTAVLDVLVRNDHRQLCGRPRLTLMQDQASGFIIGWEVTYNPPSGQDFFAPKRARRTALHPSLAKQGVDI